jgi:hypothetical protein
VALSPNIETLFVGRFLTIIGAGGLTPSVGKLPNKAQVVLYQLYTKVVGMYL